MADVRPCLAVARRRTPKRCCSSMTARSRLRKRTSSRRSRVCNHPRRSRRLRVPRGHAKVVGDRWLLRMARHTPRPGHRFERGQMLARENLGRRHDALLHPASTAASRAAIATTVLPNPHRPGEQMDHAAGPGHAGEDFVDRRRLGLGELEGRAASALLPHAAVAFERPAGLAADIVAYERQCELIGEQLVIGKPHSRFRLQRQVGLGLRRVCGAERVGEGRERVMLAPCRAAHLGQIRQAFQRMADRFGRACAG